MAGADAVVPVAFARSQTLRSNQDIVTAVGLSNIAYEAHSSLVFPENSSKFSSWHSVLWFSCTIVRGMPRSKLFQLPVTFRLKPADPACPYRHVTVTWPAVGSPCTLFDPDPQPRRRENTALKLVTEVPFNVLNCLSLHIEARPAAAPAALSCAGSSDLRRHVYTAICLLLKLDSRG